MKLTTILKNISFKVFLLFDNLGIHVLPKHYYTPIPDYQWLRRNKQAWANPAVMAGVRWELQEQLDWVEGIIKPYYSEVAELKSYDEITRRGLGPGFGPIESQVVHCFIRSAKPARVVEIGCGVSTAVMLQAAQLNAGEGQRPTQFTCVEPYPKPAFRNTEGITLVEHLCQTVPHEVFAQLGRGDLLFIDSSHAVKPGSDVVRIYLDIIPRLAPGVTIHIHDIYLPYLYSEHVLNHYFGWQETSLLLALLTNNERLSVLAGLAALH